MFLGENTSHHDDTKILMQNNVQVNIRSRACKAFSLFITYAYDRFFNDSCCGSNCTRPYINDTKARKCIKKNGTRVPLSVVPEFTHLSPQLPQSSDCPGLIKGN